MELDRFPDILVTTFHPVLRLASANNQVVGNISNIKDWIFRNMIPNIAYSVSSRIEVVQYDICHKQMSCDYLMRKHRVTVHGIEDGAFFCPICPRKKVVFFSEKLLKVHMKNKHDF